MKILIYMKKDGDLVHNPEAPHIEEIVSESNPFIVTNWLLLER